MHDECFAQSGVVGRLMPFAAFLQGPPVIPEIYWNVYSSEQRWKVICERLEGLIEYTQKLADAINKINVDVATKTELEQLKGYVDSQVADLKQLIKQLTEGALQWDVQHGSYTDTVSAQRDMFNDLTVHSITVEELANSGLCVKTLADSGLNVRGLAVMSYWLVEKFDLPAVYEYNEQKVEGSRFSADALKNAVVNEKGYVMVP